MKLLFLLYMDIFKTQWVKVLATKHNILSLISRLIIEAENQL